MLDTAEQKITVVFITNQFVPRAEKQVCQTTEPSDLIKDAR